MLGAGAFTENFRSALNGFNRTDVVQFIQRQTVEHDKAMRLLREENARLKQAAKAAPDDNADNLRAAMAELETKLESLTQELADAQEKNRELMAENRSLAESLTATKAELTAVQAEAATAGATQSAAPAVTSPLDRPIAPPAGMAVAPSSFDEMELAAYRRAEQTERMARERAAAASERIQGVFRQAESKMSLTAEDMNALIDTLRNNCDQMEALMESARNILTESAQSLKASADLSTPF